MRHAATHEGFGPKMADVTPLEQDLATRWKPESGDHLGKLVLSIAGDAGYTEDLAGGDVEAEISQRG
jgi:hypothetical protein